MLINLIILYKSRNSYNLFSISFNATDSKKVSDKTIALLSYGVFSLLARFNYHKSEAP